MRALYDYELVKTTVIHFPVKQQLSNCIISTISSATANLAAKASLAFSVSSNVVVAVAVIAPSFSVCLCLLIHHDNISFVLYKSIG